MLIPPSIIFTYSRQELAALCSLVKAGQGYYNKHGRPLSPIDRAIINDLDKAANHYLNKRQARLDTTTPQAHSWLTAKELAKQCGYSTRHIQRHAQHFGGTKYKGAWRFPPHLKDETKGTQL